LALVFMGASCGSTISVDDTSDEVASDFIENCPVGANFLGETPHGSVLCDGVDSALIGTWQLTSQVVMGQSLRLEEDQGRTLMIYPMRAFVEDYSTEAYEKMSVNSPDGLVVSQCFGSGTSGGNYYVSYTLDGNGEVSTMTLEADRDMGVNELEVTCEGPGASTSASSTSVPLGSGAGSYSCDGDFDHGCVLYEYNMSADGSQLIVSTASGAAMTLTFERIN